jgi:hypothetical protein
VDEYEHTWTFVSQPASGDPVAEAVREGKANMAMGDRFFRFARHADADGATRLRIHEVYRARQESGRLMRLEPVRDGFTREVIVPSITLEGEVDAGEFQSLNDDFVLLAARQLFRAALPALLEDATK